ncbi:FluC/FEX family fluoride channel [Corynebacterium caspium]|uniref:FluC/FEX family fluoride channel n=1 Tax=Corynebacterium caspium TaxID=234828 RepID=UPI001FE107DA|nr:CrcB family protein [Corynebacterium caspium]
MSAGAFLGGSARYLLSLKPGGHLGTLLANALACLVLGYLSRYFLVHPPTTLLYQFGAVGFAGALSTWSTLANELGKLLVDGKYVQLLQYLSTTLLAGSALFATGFYCNLLLH